MLSKFCLILSLTAAATARTFTVYNACPFTIWPAVFTDLNVGSAVPAVETGWEAKKYTSRKFTVPSKSGSFPAQTDSNMHR